MGKLFLTGQWRKLIMVNYVINPEILSEYIPSNTTIDFWNKQCFVSLVGFMFKETRVKGIRVPCHVNFEEVNLRFYVKYYNGLEFKRGVVFIKEIVPKPALTLVANTLFDEHYETMPMKHNWKSGLAEQHIEYKWKKKRWNSLSVNASIISKPIVPDSQEEFITEHYWGYTKNDQKTSEYEVQHPKWEVYDINNYSINVDFQDIYGKKFDFLKNQKPYSIFLAEGSDIAVYQGNQI
jgi:hypothetical protein